MDKNIPYSKPSITDLEVELASDAAKNGWGVNCYKYINKFENGTTNVSDDGVIFNTNTIHKAGDVDNERHVIILHFQH